MNRVKIASAGLALAVTALVIPATAQAADQPVVVEAIMDRPSIRVSYADLNLAEEAGLKRLNRRVRSAANRLCIQPGLQPMGEEMSDQACRAEALEDAGRQIELAVAKFGNSRFAAASRTVEVALR